MVDKVSGDGRVKSKWGRVTANQSQLHCVFAHSNIDLTNTSAADIHSKWGGVVIRQTDGTRRKVSHIDAHTIDVQNCEIEQAACEQKAVIKDSIVKNLTLNVDPRQEGFLDLTNTRVLDKIVIAKKKNPILRIWQISIDFFGYKYERDSENENNSSGPFRLLIRGNAILKNIRFEGFESSKFTYKKTAKGTLVTEKTTA